MGWTWRYESADGTQLQPRSGTSEPFGNQAEAESWLGEAFRALLDEGVDQVSLLNEGNDVYSMSLHPAE